MKTVRQVLEKDNARHIVSKYPAKLYTIFEQEKFPANPCRPTNPIKAVLIIEMPTRDIDKAITIFRERSFCCQEADTRDANSFKGETLDKERVKNQPN